MKIFALALVLLVISSCSSRPYRPSTQQTSVPTPIQTSKRGSSPSPSPIDAPTVTPAPTDASQLALQYERQGQYLAALKEFVTLSVSSPTKQQQEYFRLKSLEVVENRLSEDELDEVASESDYGFVRGHALFRLGELSMQRRDTSAARRYFSSVVSFLPDSDIAYRSQEYISQIDSVRYVESKTIGVILPLSGKNSAVAQKALRAVQMGLGLQGSESRYKLAIMDSEGDPDNARRSVERLVKEDSAIAIIGGLLSKTASTEVSKANELGIPSIVLSQKAGLTDIGPSIFRNSVTSEMQVHHLVHVAMEQKGMRRFAILYPNDSYGIEYANIFWDEVLARGGTIAAAQTYSPTENDFSGQIQRLVGTYYIEARLDEYKNRAREIKQNQKNRSVRHEVRIDDTLLPVVDFDAIFIPDSSKALGQISAFLSYSGVKGVNLLGTNLWNSPGLAKRAGHFANNLLFVDGVLNQSANYQTSNFIKEYKVLFTEEPSLIEIQAYDSAVLLRQLISDGATSRDELARKLAETRRFPGALGPMDMSRNRELIRPMVTLTLNREGLIVPAVNASTP